MRGWQRVVLALVVVLGLGVVATASPARAAEYRGCDWHYDTPNGEGTLTFYKSYNLKVGPLGECDHVASVAKGTTFYVWCEYWNQYDNMWFYGRIAGTQTMGWAYQDAFGPKIVIGDDNNDGVVNIEYCGF